MPCFSSHSDRCHPIAISAVTSHTSATSAVNTPILSVPAAAVSSATTSSAPQSFLQNPALEGGIFALVGIAALAIIFTVVACIIRTRRRKRVTQTVSFAPNVTERYGGAKPQGASFNERRLSQSASADHVSHFGPPSAFVSKSFSPQSYQAFAVGQETPSTPHSPITPHGSPNSQSSCSGPSERSGGASLTRKLSDRKPVPPLLPGISESHRLTLPPHLHATDHPRPKVPRILPEPEQGPEQKQNFPRSLEVCHWIGLSPGFAEVPQSISPAAAPETHGTPPGLSKLETAPDE